MNVLAAEAERRGLECLAEATTTDEERSAEYRRHRDQARKIVEEIYDGAQCQMARGNEKMRYVTADLRARHVRTANVMEQLAQA